MIAPSSLLGACVLCVPLGLVVRQNEDRGLVTSDIDGIVIHDDDDGGVGLNSQILRVGCSRYLSC